MMMTIDAFDDDLHHINDHDDNAPPSGEAQWSRSNPPDHDVKDDDDDERNDYDDNDENTTIMTKIKH